MFTILKDSVSYLDLNNASGILSTRIYQTGSNLYNLISGGISNNSYFINSGSGLFVFRTNIDTGVYQQYIPFPTIMDNKPLLVASLHNDVDNSIISSQASGINSSGFWALFSELIANTGYYMDAWVCNSTGTGLATTVIVNNSFISGYRQMENGFTGIGTNNYIPKFTYPSGLIDSVIAESGGNIGISTTAPISKLDVSGDIYASGGKVLTAADSGNLQTQITNTGQNLYQYITSLSGTSLSGLIIVKHSDGSQTSYNPISNTDSARGDALLQAYSGANTGDTINVYRGNYFISQPIAKDGVDWDFHNNTLVQMENGITTFQLNSTQNNFNIYGYGNFSGSGYGGFLSGNNSTATYSGNIRINNAQYVSGALINIGPRSNIDIAAITMTTETGSMVSSNTMTFGTNSIIRFSSSYLAARMNISSNKIEIYNTFMDTSGALLPRTIQVNNATDLTLRNSKIICHPNQTYSMGQVVGTNPSINIIGFQSNKPFGVGNTSNSNFKGVYNSGVTDYIPGGLQLGSGFFPLYTTRASNLQPAGVFEFDGQELYFYDNGGRRQNSSTNFKTVRSNKINFKTSTNYRLYTVPANYLFLVDSMEIISSDVQNSADAPYISFGNSSDSGAYTPGMQTTSNSQYSRHILNNPQDAIPAGTVLTVSILTGSTATIHSGHCIFKGSLIENSTFWNGN